MKKIIVFKKQRIKDLRELQGMSGVEFAQILGISKQLLSAWEKGQYTPSMESFLNIVNTFQVSPSSFFEEGCFQSEDNNSKKKIISGKL